MKVDLHLHSRYSDGTSTPAEVARRVKVCGVTLAFLTDHDSVTGFPEAAAAAREHQVDLRCGIEINSAAGNIHILGYGIRWQDPAFLARIDEFRGRRTERIRRIVEKLRGIGIDVAFEDVRATAHETLGRPHVADALLRKGLVKSRKEAFDRFLAAGKPGFVESMGPTPEEAIEVIRAAGGFASLAHPETLPDKESVGAWKAVGLEGLEVYYGSHRPAEINRYKELADRHGLLATGGSDFHGPGTGRDNPLGVDLPPADYDRFMERLARC